MKPVISSNREPQVELFSILLERICDRNHELLEVSRRLNWPSFEEKFGNYFHPSTGRPGISTRLMVGLHYLKYTYDLSDEEVLARWVENPYWQSFCGEEYFRHELPIHSTSMTKWRKKVGAEGSEQLLRETITVALQLKVVATTDLRQVNVDTTVQEKAVTFPTDSKLYFKMRATLVKLAQGHGIPLRQSYTRVGRRALLMANRYFHARQPRRAKREVRKLKTQLGRVMRDIKRQIAACPELQGFFQSPLETAERLLKQQPTDKHKLYSLHAPEVECIAKGKAHKKYEFGNKVSVVTTNRRGLVLGILALHGNPYDGHTLNDAISQAERLAGIEINRDVFVDRGYRGHNYTGPATVHIPGKKIRSRALKRRMQHRSVIEAKIGHMKNHSRLDRNFLLGTLGDKINAILSGAAINFRLLLAAIRLLSNFSPFSALLRHLGALIASLRQSQQALSNKVLKMKFSPTPA